VRADFRKHKNKVANRICDQCGNGLALMSLKCGKCGALIPNRLRFFLLAVLWAAVGFWVYVIWNLGR
jgi:hypothetical protein